MLAWSAFAPECCLQWATEENVTQQKNEERGGLTPVGFPDDQKSSPATAIFIFIIIFIIFFSFSLMWDVATRPTFLPSSPSDRRLQQHRRGLLEPPKHLKSEEKPETCTLAQRESASTLTDLQRSKSALFLQTLLEYALGLSYHIPFIKHIQINTIISV